MSAAWLTYWIGTALVMLNALSIAEKALVQSGELPRPEMYRLSVILGLVGIALALASMMPRGVA